MYRFLYHPRWIIIHVLIVALVVTMINLMFWQFRRYHEREALNEKLVQGSRARPIPLDDALADIRREGANKLQYRTVEFSGTFDAAAEVTVANRTFNSAPGRWVATPLRPTGGGAAVLVVRGWIPEAITGTTPPIAGVEPPAGPVKVTGYLDLTQTKGYFGAADPPTGTLHSLQRVDVARFGKQFGPVVRGVFVQLTTQSPASSSTEINPVPPPDPDAGPFESYAYQWLLFSIVATVGYPLALRRRAHSKGAGDSGDEDHDSDTVQRDAATAVSS
jgi:cytochrome oxidase assembly protein ShyY1